MKKLIALTLAASVVIFGQARAVPAAKKSAAAPKVVSAKVAPPVKSYKDLKYPTLNSIQVPTPERYVLANGMTVFLLEDHELPFVNASAVMRIGERWEPADKAGLAGIAASVMRTGGTATRGGDQLDDELDRLAFKSDGHFAETPNDWGDPDKTLQQAQFFQILDACMERLPPALGRLFLMREWLELSTQEVCKELSLTPTNLYVQLHRARLRLQECMNIHWFGNRGT